MIATAAKTRATNTSRASDKTSPTTVSDEAEAPTIVAARAARESVRSMIEVEIRRQDAFPVARRTLQLLAEAVVEPAAEPPFYRVVDRTGAPRQGETGPLTLEDLFAELRERHGALFVPVPPKPVVEMPPEPTASDEIKAATARFVGSQSERARSVMARSVARGRSAAATVSASLAGTLSNVRHSLADRPTGGQGSNPQPTLRERGMGIGASFGDKARETVAIARERLSGFAAGDTAASPSATPVQGGQPARWPGLVARAGDRLRRLRRDDGTILTRLSTLAGVSLLGSLALVLLLTHGGGDDRPALAPDTETPRQEAKAQDPGQATPPTETQPAQNRPSTMANPRETVSPTAPPGIPAEEPSPPSAEESRTKPAEPSNAITGKTEVIDTATLRVGGKLVRLFGVEWVRGGQPEELTRYLAGRPVTCQPVAGSAAYLCAVEGRDLSEVVLFNGGGRASSEATPDLVAAEDRARTERLGVWAR
ncbi:hypothetical protein MBUL_01066 [Methylobacterium bullatum]|uniref:TNase-like domain-containing protein n=1 Tax=Methylobacterium bullatum TaxID=570505 RepID=A0A679IPV9_9HYPH|nr:hypothetical protein MBUL_01066 [Methylobacterium bullatum]